MTARRVLVYAGPTVSPEDVHGVLPGAEVRPPVARGDLFPEEWHSGDAVVIVDGYFRERRSVGYKELLWVLEQGVDVVGAASMGALRAAELSPYGMRGVGEVYRMYASGEVDGDDEVGILHGPADRGYPPLTVALVNLRYGCREAVRSGLFPEATGRRVVAAAQALPFTHRTWREIAARLDGRDGADDGAALETLERRIGSGEWDLKHRDAMTALAGLRADAPDVSAASEDGPPVARRPVGPTWIAPDQVPAYRSRTEQAPGRWVADLDVLDAGRLFDDEYPALHEEVLLAKLAELAAADGLTPEAFAAAKLGLDATMVLPDRLASWFTDDELARLAPADRLQVAMLRVWRPSWFCVDWRPAVLERARASDRWRDWAAVVVRADEAREEDRHRLVVPPPQVCGTLFTRHWQRRGTTQEIELARRGFAGKEQLGRVVTRFFAYDLRRARSNGTRVRAATSGPAGG